MNLELTLGEFRVVMSTFPCLHDRERDLSEASLPQRLSKASHEIAYRPEKLGNRAFATAGISLSPVAQCLL